MHIKKVFLLVLALAIAIEAFLPPAVAQEAVPIMKIEKQSVVSGKEFTVDVILDNADKVYNGNFTLQYDNTKVEVIDTYQQGDILNGHNMLCNTDYQSNGNKIRVTFNGAYPLREKGTLITLSFKAIGSADSTTSLEFVSHKLYNEKAELISSSVSNGNISIKEDETQKPVLSVEDPDYLDNGEFVIPVYITNAKNVNNGNFTLQYDSTKITPKSYTFGTIFNGHTKNCNLDYQSAGNLIRFTFSGAYSLSSDGILLNITFSVIEGSSGIVDFKFNAFRLYDKDSVQIESICKGKEISINANTVNVDVTWGSMEFIYDDGTWDTTSHKWVGSRWKPSSENSNAITVKNNGSSTVKASFSYTAATGYESLSGVFSDSTKTDISEPETVVKDAEKTYYLELTGTLEERQVDSFIKVGTVTLTLSE